MPDFELGGTVSRRSGSGDRPWDEVLADPSIAAVAISTENTRHARLTEEALHAGKHVLCDYPLAFSRHEAASLLDLARRKDRVLHVEHIGLLASAHAAAVREIARLGKLKGGEYRFEGNWSEKWSNPAFTGPLPFIAYSRLMQVAEWFGPFETTARDFHADADEFFIHLRLNFEAGGSIDFFEVRKPDLERRRGLEATFQNGSLSWHPRYESEGLFGKDLALFRRRIQEKAEAYYHDDLMLLCLETLQDIA